MLPVKSIHFIFLYLISFLPINAINSFDESICPSGKQSYEYLMSNAVHPFALSVGTSLSQTHISENTINPEYVRKQMLKIAKKMGPLEGEKWLRAESRIWYLLRAMPEYSCINGHNIHVATLDLEHRDIAVKDILSDLEHNQELQLKKCPLCQEKIDFQREQQDLFTVDIQDKIAGLVHYLNIDLLKLKQIPNMRISIEIADILKSGTTEIDDKKLENLTSFIKKLGNPMIFFHHYANPIQLSNLFEKQEHAEWFANICARIIEKLPNITHVCPISQPTGFVFRVTRNQDLPPFEYTVEQDKLLENIMKASALASDKMKNVRDKNSKDVKLNVLVSHQWKIMIPKHSYYDPRYALELLVTTIADKMYNGKFVSAVQPYISKFDGIALSVYPSLKFDMWKPDGSNILGEVDYQGSLGAVIETNKAFADKDIYIVEAGCNNADPKIKKEYIDMMLCVCARARYLGIPVKSLYFWAITNHPDFYMEWNTARGVTYFAPFDDLNIESINQGGKYLKEIIESVKQDF
ncbi:hypothetical protein HYV10_00835 [Candidatus Dependentiae bacterium]|nr:hypothetical protein [Candidatus Dependentiae bacterium]